MYDTPNNIAVMNRSVSEYIWTKAPNHEIDQAISWLDAVKADCDYKIAQLHKVKLERQRSKDWRNKINQLTADFMKDDYLVLSYENLEAEVRHRFHNYHFVTEAYIKTITKNAFRESQRRLKEKRDIRIAQEYQSGFSVAEIAKKNDLTRQAVYHILKNNRF